MHIGKKSGLFSHSVVQSKLICQNVYIQFYQLYQVFVYKKYNLQLWLPAVVIMPIHWGMYLFVSDGQ